MKNIARYVVPVLIVFSQNGYSINSFSDKDSITYYENLSHKLLITTGINSTFSDLTIKNRNDNKELEIKPLGQVSLTAGFNYKWLGLELGIGLPASKIEKEKKGNTTKLDLQLNIYSRRIGADLFLQHYKGFHIDNPRNFSNWKSDTLPQLPQMEQYAIGATAFYIFNHNKFSYSAPYVRNARQIKSAGSLLGGVYFNLDAAASNGGFVPHDSLLITARDSFPIYAYNSTSFGVSVGYSYTLVISPSFFLNLALMPGFGRKQIKVETFKIDSGTVQTNSVATTNGISSRVMFRAAIGYEKNDFAIGTSFYSSQGTIAIRHFEFNPGLGTFRIFVAKRFGLNKKAKIQTTQ
ncbi:MAG: DUF4421 family protein [Flavobacteriales bacterium]